MLLVALATVMFISVPTAFADFIPSWRGQEGSTYQAWWFSTDSKTPLPEEVDNPYGAPLLRVDTAYDWLSDGAWPLSGEMDIYIPNRDMRLDQKDIQLQLTWRPGNRDQTPFLPDQPIVGITTNPLFDSMQLSRQDLVLPIGGWILSTFTITLWPNVDEEWFTIKGDIEVDGVIIDTICVPEPATIALLGMGTLAMLKNRRRFNSV